MKKKKPKQAAAPLSPKNYIKQRARNLPIEECWINSHWKEAKMANVVVVRKHTNGNLTFGMYLVDLLMRGVKNVAFYFNISPAQYQEFIESYRIEIAEKIDYSLAHNIIFKSIEFAKEHGFYPHPDFSITKYILEDENIEIDDIEIEFGLNGKPVFME